MRKSITFLLMVLVLTSCDKKDPILPGDRTAIFVGAADVNIMNTSVENVPDVIDATVVPCKYTQDSNNVIWDGTRKIFAGFPTSNSVKSTQKPVCAGKYVYAGLTTGELVKINPKNRDIVWIADIYRASNMTGGADVVDIVAPILIVGNSVYVGGLGDAYCKIDASSGRKDWCLDIGVALPFIANDDVSYVVATDNKLYAIRNSDGAVYWAHSVKRAMAPELRDGKIIVGKQKINAKTGK